MNDAPRAARFLEWTLLANVLLHTLAILTMGLWLIPGLPGGPTADVADRAAHVAAHPWLWRLGWLPWHLCAFIDLLTGVALVATRWIPRLPAVLTLIVTLCAVVPEQIGEVAWVTRGVDLAIQATDNPTALVLFEDLESRVFQLTVVYGASLYMVMSAGWTWCFVVAGTWSRTLTWLSVATWGSLAVGSLGLLLPPAYRPSDLVVAITNGLGFPLLVVWLWLVSERVLGRSRPSAVHGRQMPWVHPWHGILGHFLTRIGTSRVLRKAGELLPTPTFRSDITDVVYVNYLVEADRLLALVPMGLELQRLGDGGRFALVSVLTYNHGHFGPAMLGPLRKLMPSPVQTNWRIYVHDPRTGKRGIYFFTNAISKTPQALGARLLSEGMPMHVLARASVIGQLEGHLTLDLDPGSGSAPDLRADLRPGPVELPSEWAAVWGSYKAFLEYAVTQDRALSSQVWYGRITRQEIRLEISLDACKPLIGEVESRAARAVVGDAVPVCFHVPRVDFRFAGEAFDGMS